jgi:hypothetical protein
MANKNNQKNESMISKFVKNFPVNPRANPQLNPELNKLNSYLDSLIVFLNPKSGALKGRIVFEKFKNYLKSENIFDLSEINAKNGLNISINYYIYVYYNIDNNVF